MADLQKMAEAILARPEFIGDSAEGTENITREDVQIPRLAVAQALSPEIEEGNAKFIEGLRSGEIFNSLTGQIYGKGPLEIAVVRADQPRFVEFIPRNEGGGVRDPNVDKDDERTKWTVDDKGKRIKPIATMFYDFLIVLDPHDKKEILAFSLKSTGITVAKSLNAFIKLRNAPIYSGVYTVTSVNKKSAQGPYSQFNVKPNGWVRDKDTFEWLKGLYDSLKEKAVKIHTEDSHEEDDTFNYGENTANPNEEM